jgi:hypothetical protein
MNLFPQEKNSNNAVYPSVFETMVANLLNGTNPPRVCAVIAFAFGDPLKPYRPKSFTVEWYKDFVMQPAIPPIDNPRKGPPL